MKIKNITLGLVFILAGLSAKSQDLVRPVITGAPFLQVVPDARAGGMGESGVATLPDAFSQFHNPAKFLFMEENAQGVSLSYIPQFIGYAKDIFHGNAAYFRKLNERSAISSSLTYFNFGEVQVEEEMGGEIINQGTYIPNELAFDATYSLKLNNNFGMSVSGRYIRSDITQNQPNSNVQLKTGHAVAADVTGYYLSAAPELHVNKWSAGVSLRNLGSKLKYADESEFEYPLPTSLKLGGGYHIASGDNDFLSFYGEMMKFLVPATNDDRRLPDDSAFGGMFHSFADAPNGFSEEMKEVIYSLGSELNLNQVFSFRAGYITQSKEKGYRNHVSVGAGVHYKQLVFDFAYQSPVGSNVSFQEDKVVKLSLTFRLDDFSGKGRVTETNETGLGSL